MSFLDTIKSWFSRSGQEQTPEPPREPAATATPPSAPSPTEPVVTPPTTEEGDRPSDTGP
jgi:hypothetical protein